MKKLYRSKTDCKLGGVCGGIAQYFEVDSTLIRIIFIIGILCSGSGLIAYLLMYLIMPVED